MSSDEEESVEIMVYRRKFDPLDESWHIDVSDIVYNTLKGHRVCWNYAWIEYKINRTQLDEFKKIFLHRGNKLTIDGEYL